MNAGFLSLITHPEYPGLVRVCIHSLYPEQKHQKDGSEIRYLARFVDSEAGLMHVQNAMHSALVDRNNHIYRKSLSQMIVCVEADSLDHEQVWIDPEIPAEELERIDILTRQRKVSRQRIDLTWRVVGYLGLLLLLITSLRL
jgi:hypothetical protein